MSRLILVLFAVLVAVGATGLGFGFGRFAVSAAHHPNSEPVVGANAVAGAAEIGFAQDMSVHHEQAVHMARLVQGRVGPEIAAVAAQISEVQISETGMMRGWLALWDAPQLAANAPMAWMGHDHAGLSTDQICTTSDTDGSATSDMSPMPGMASVAELDELASLEGTQLEIRFLQLMVRHHRGGLHMADAAVSLAAVPAVRDAAMLMGADQTQEIALMLQLLKARGAAELPIDGYGYSG